MITDNKFCKICGKESLNEIAIGELKLIYCQNCDIHYSENFSSNENIADYYKKSYVITAENIEDIEFRRLFRAPEQLQLVRQIMIYSKPPAKILDIGCDKGFFIDQASRFGYTCKGIELSESAVSYAKRSGLDISSDIVELKDKYDIAVMWHSLEHFTEPAKFLTNLKNVLSDGAFIFIRVPAFDSLWRKMLGPKWIWFQPKNHYFHYSIKSLTELLNRTGFEPLIIKHRKPNNLITRRQYIISSNLIRREFGYQQSFRKRLLRLYEDITGVEIYAVAKLNK